MRLKDFLYIIPRTFLYRNVICISRSYLKDFPANTMLHVTYMLGVISYSTM